MKKQLLAGACSLISLLALNATAQTPQWWDNNGASAATGGTWDTNTANWANSAALTASTVAYANGNFPIFAAGSGGIVSLAINVPGAVTCEGLGDATTSSGTASGAAITNLTFSGAGSINLPAGSWSFECGNSSPAPQITINVPITGPGGFVQHNSGALYLYGNNTYSGGTTITGGQITYYNNNASFGTGPLTNTGSSSIWNTSASVVTLSNAVVQNTASVLNFAGGSTICTGPWTLLATTLIKNNSSAGIPGLLTLSGAISGAFGINFQAGNGGTIVLSGANTYTGATIIGTAGTSPQPVSVSTINSVTTPAQQASSSLGKPSSVANGTIGLGSTTATGQLTYTGSGETSDRVINLSGTTGGGIIEMDGTGPLVFTSACTATGAGIKTLTLQGSSTAANTIAGAIVNSSSATSLTKAQAGTWVLTGTNTFTGATTISAGTLTIGGAGRLNSGSYAGNITDNATFIYGSSLAQTLSGTISGTGALTDGGTGVLTLSGANTYAGTSTLSAGTVQLNHADIAGTSGPLGKATAAGSIVLGGGTLQYVAVNAGHDYSSRFSTAASQQYNIDVNGQPVTFSTALTSSGGVLSLKSTAAGGVLTLNAGETYSGFTAINSGTLTIGSAGSLGSGNYGGSITDSGAFIYGGSSPQILSGNITGSGSLAQNGTGGLTLSGTDTYTGATTIGAASTLYLSGSGSISSASLSIAVGGTLDVSALASPYNLNSTSLTASGSSSAAATINGAPGGVVNLGSQPISLTISPTLFNGELTQPALVIPQSLTVDGNVITVNNASGTPLGAGSYILIQAGSGTTTGTPSQYVTVTGSGLVAGDYAMVQVSGGNVILVVMQPANNGPTWTGNDYGTSQTWSDIGNWAGGVPDAIGDQVIFDNTSGSQTPVMDSSYSVYSLTFAGGCSSDTLTASGGSSLTVGSGVTNSSGNPQTVAMPVQLVDLGGPLVPSQWDVSGGNISASGVISDNNTGLAVSGANTLTLSAPNTYTGGTTVNASATLSANTIADTNCSIGPSGTVTLSGGTLDYTGATGASTARTVKATAGTTSTIDVPTNVTLALNSLTGTATSFINKTDDGTLILGGTTDNSGLVMNINAGTVIITKSTTATVHGLGAGTNTVAGGAALQLAGSGSFDLYNACVLTVASGGLFDVNGQNDNFSTLTLSGNGFGSGAMINSAGGTTSLITNTGSGVVLAGPVTIGGPGNIALSGVVSGGGIPLTYAGTGTLTLSGASTYSGGTTLNAGGTLQLTTGGIVNSSAGSGAITLNDNSALNVYMTNTEMNNVITGSTNTLINIRMGSGNLWLSNSLAGQLNNFAGTLNVSSTSATGGQLVVGTAALTENINSSATWQIQSGAVVDFNGGQTDPATVYLYGLPYTGATIGSLRLDDSVQSGPVILMGNSQIGNGSAAGASTVSGVISDGGSGFGFSKMGADPVILSAANTYTGATIVSAGTLDISSTGSIAGNATVNAGTTLELDNASSLVTNATVSVNATGVVNLNYGGTQNINALYVGGVQQAPGVYGAGAFNAGGVFTGSGTLTVASGPPVTISAPTVDGNNQLVISWNSVVGGNYNVYSTTNLSLPLSSWTLVNSSPIPATGATTTYTLPGNIASQPALFITVQQ